MIYRELLKLKENNKSIKTAIIGAGLMGKGLVSQLMYVPAMRPSLVATRRIEEAIEAYRRAGADKSDIVVAKSMSDVEDAIIASKYVVTDRLEFANVSAIDCIVEATGDPNTGAKVAYDAINNGKNIVMLNVEADVTCGTKLKKMADKAGVVYTGSAGDEPGAVMELYDFAMSMGFEVLAVGKGKNNPIDYCATPDSCRTQAEKVELNPWMLSSFVDGTKTMIELNAMANATGFVPDVVGGHGFESDAAGLAEVFKLKSEGGGLDSYGIVDYVKGVAPGVFIIIRAKNAQIDSELRFLKLGKGPNYALYRPYHLTSLETPMSIAKAVLYKATSIASAFDENIAETVSVAKRNIKAGEHFDAIGGYTFLGKVMKAEDAKADALVPVGLIDDETVAVRDISAGEYITFKDIEFRKQNFVQKFVLE